MQLCVTSCVVLIWLRHPCSQVMTHSKQVSVCCGMLSGAHRNTHIPCLIRDIRQRALSSIETHGSLSLSWKGYYTARIGTNLDTIFAFVLVSNKISLTLQFPTANVHTNHSTSTTSLLMRTFYFNTRACAYSSDLRYYFFLWELRNIYKACDRTC